jgi:peptide/nickel transport system ATP-binding protein
LHVFFGLGRREARARVEELLERVRLSSSAAEKYPDQLSGGERQRVAVARALAAEPSVIICDEITSALDVSVQAAIVQMLGRLQRESGMSLLFITHDLALVRTISDRVAVMSGGEVVESGATEAVFADPRAPYTRRLIDDTPDLKLDPAILGGPATAVATDTHAG